MNGQNAQQHRTIPRHNRIPYDRAEHRRVMQYELSLVELTNTKPIPIGSIDEFCEYIGICHSACTRGEAQSCSDYPLIYEEWKKAQQLKILKQSDDPYFITNRDNAIKRIKVKE